MEWDPGQSSDSGRAWTDLPAGFGVSPEEPEVTGHTPENTQRSMKLA